LVDRSERAGPDVAPDSRNPIVVRLTAEALGHGELKRVVVAEDVPKGSAFEVISDEGVGIGGDDSAPTPLSYFAAAVAF
jgi:hypothetical protein